MNGNIPVLFVEGNGLAEAWEKSLIEVYNKGCEIKTEYDRRGDPPSKDSTMTIVVKNPLEEPMIHKDIPCGLEDLQEYVLEVLEGIKDHLIRDSAADDQGTGWEYTYHQRLFEYSIPGIKEIYDQIELLAEKLSKTPHSRRAQAITWKVWDDNFCNDPACLQSIWCRLLQDSENNWYLNTNVRFRSNDAYKAAFMNMFALVQLQLKIAEKISTHADLEIKLGRYVHQADSYHIYGSYFHEFEKRFIKALKIRTFEERSYRYEDVKYIMDESVPAILDKASKMKR